MRKPSGDFIYLFIFVSDLKFRKVEVAYFSVMFSNNLGDAFTREKICKNEYHF